MYGRERHHDLHCADYARPETNYASLPYVITAGDPLQFPPVRVAGASEHRRRAWRISRWYRDVVSIRLCVVLCVHGAMGQVGAVSGDPSGNLVHVFG